MQRPTAVTVLGILNIVFAIIGFCGLFLSVIMLLGVSAMPMPNGMHNPALELMRNSPGYRLWMGISVPIGLLTTVALLISGIGLLKMQPWARMLAIGYAVFALVFGLVGVVMNFVFLVGPLMEQASRQSGPEAAGATGGVIGGTVGGCLGLIYPVILLVFLLRPSVAAAFKGVGSGQIDPMFPPYPPQV